MTVYHLKHRPHGWSDSDHSTVKDAVITLLRDSKADPDVTCMPGVVVVDDGTERMFNADEALIHDWWFDDVDYNALEPTARSLPARWT